MTKAKFLELAKLATGDAEEVTVTIRRKDLRDLIRCFDKIMSKPKTTVCSECNGTGKVIDLLRSFYQAGNKCTKVVYRGCGGIGRVEKKKPNRRDSSCQKIMFNIQSQGTKGVSQCQLVSKSTTSSAWFAIFHVLSA
jgi:DnaJ-class molecular chaperone